MASKFDLTQQDDVEDPPQNADPDQRMEPVDDSRPDELEPVRADQERPKREPKPTEAMADFQLQLKEKDWRTARHRVEANLRQAAEHLNQAQVDKQ